MEFLGFELDSQIMTVGLRAGKTLTVHRECLCLLQTSSLSIRQVCHVIGLIVASLLRVKFEPLYYRYLERDMQVSSLEKYNRETLIIKCIYLMRHVRSYFGVQKIYLLLSAD